MLSSRELELLTAAVDGELSARERRLVSRLLRRSPEARALLRQLQGDSQQLRALPNLRAPAGLAAAVLDRIERAPRSILRRPRRLALAGRSPGPLWRGVAAAAAVLLVISGGSYLLHRGAGSPSRTAEAGALSEVESPGEPLGFHPTGGGLAVRDEAPAEGGLAVRDRGPELLPPPRGEDRPKVEPVPDEREPDGILTSGERDQPGQFERVELALPIVHRLHALDGVAEGKALAQQLRSASAFRVELTARDATRGFVRVRQALEQRKLNLVFDPATESRLQKPQWRTDVALFAENVTPAELIEVLRSVGVADRRGAERKPSEVRFDGPVIVKELSRWDRRELADLLGVDPVKSRPAPAPAPGRVDVRRPLAEDTVERVADALAGKGPPRPGASAANRRAYVTALGGGRSRSLDLNLFLASRPVPRAGTLQVFLVLRNVTP